MANLIIELSPELHERVEAKDISVSEERAAAFAEWVRSHTTGPGLSDEALRRESIYEDEQ